MNGESCLLTAGNVSSVPWHVVTAWSRLLSKTGRAQPPGAGPCNDIDSLGPRILECSRAGLGRGSGREDVIDEQDVDFRLGRGESVSANPSVRDRITDAEHANFISFSPMTPKEL